MRPNSEKELLLEKIILFREKKAYELKLVKLQFEIAKESLQPGAILKNSLFGKKVAATTKNYLMNVGIEMATGFLRNKIQSKPGGSLFKNIITTALKLIKK